MCQEHTPGRSLTVCWSVSSMFPIDGSPATKRRRTAQVAAHLIEKTLAIPVTPSSDTEQTASASTSWISRRPSKILLVQNLNPFRQARSVPSDPEPRDRYPARYPPCPVEVAALIRHVDYFGVARLFKKETGGVTRSLNESVGGNARVAGVALADLFEPGRQSLIDRITPFRLGPSRFRVSLPPVRKSPEQVSRELFLSE
jgi:hypothetical protein